MCFMHVREIALLTLLLLSSQTLAYAIDDPQARKHYERALSLVKLGDHAGAIRELELSYKANPRPNRLYDIAEQHRILAEAGALDQMRLSLDFFERYLKEKPDASDRAEVQSRIVELRARIASAEAAAREVRPKPIVPEAAVSPAPPPPSMEVKEKRPTPTWVWVVTGVGAAVVVGGAIGLGVGLTQGSSAPDASNGTVPVFP